VRSGASRRRRALGFTLVELVLTLLLISIAALGVGYTLSFGLGREADSLWQAKAVALAAAYFEEIEAKRYDETSPLGGVPPCSPSTTPCSAAGAFNDGETRAEFDDVDDYDGLNDAPPLDAEGNVRTGYERYVVNVTVAYLSGAIATGLGLDGASDAKRVEVAVTSPEGDVLRFASIRANF
jgi:MSHA pilin protein MshD